MAQKHMDFGLDFGTSEAREAMRLAWRNCVEAVSEMEGVEREWQEVPAGRESPQDWFEALDGSTVRLRGAEWHLEVFSVVMDQAATWLQVLLAGEPSHLLTLKLPPHEGVGHVLSILSSWLADPGQATHVLNVA